MITNIQVLRGVAALMVVLFHLVVQLRPYGFDGSRVSFLQGGVDIFFVISGFIMVHVARERARSGGQFMADRIIRIVPLYWLLTLIAYFVGAAATRPFGDLLRSLAFIPSGAAPLFNPLVDGGWTLNLEMYFYAIFAASLAIARAEQHRFAIVVGSLAAVCAAALWLPGRFWPFYGNEIVFEFVIGMVLARSMLRLKAIEPRAAWFIMLVGGLLIGFEPFAGLGSRLLSDGLPAGLIVAGAISLDAAGKRATAPAALLLGAISYALYLSHVLVFEVIGGTFAQSGQTLGPAQTAGFLVLACLAALLTAWLIHIAFERPVTAALNRFKTGRSPG